VIRYHPVYTLRTGAAASLLRTCAVRCKEQSQVRRPDTVVRVEAEALEHRRHALACRVDVVVGFEFHLDELAQSRHVIDSDGTAVDEVPLAFLADCRGPFVSEPRENPSQCLGVRDRGLCLLPGFRRGVDEWSLVGQGGGRVSVDRFGPDPERLVRLGEVPVGRVVVDVLLLDRPARRRVERGKAVPGRLGVGLDFQFDLVHPVRGCRNGVLKSTTTDPQGMSNDAETDDEQESGESAPEAEASDDQPVDAETEGGDGADSEETEESGLAEGDFIKLDYTARTVEGGDLVDTTDPDVAEEEDVDADQEFAPRTIVLGEGHIFDSVEEDIVGKAVGDTGSVVVSAPEAFGEYDEEEVRTISKDKIPEDDRYPGAQVTVENQQGFVETIIGGRARVDFNHPLAGEDIEYEYEVVGVVEDRNEQAQGLLEMFLDMQLETWLQTDTVEEEQLVEDDDADEKVEGEDDDAEPEFETVEVEKESLYIEATPQLSMNQQWMMQKQQLGQQLIDLLGIDRIVVQETIEGGGMGMPGMMGGGMGGGDLEAALEEADIDADELTEELE